jgi:hypothetical protein
MILHHYGLPQLIREKYPRYWNNSGCRLLYIMDEAIYQGKTATAGGSGKNRDIIVNTVKHNDEERRKCQKLWE